MITRPIFQRNANFYLEVQVFLFEKFANFLGKLKLTTPRKFTLWISID